MFSSQNQQFSDGPARIRRHHYVIEPVREGVPSPARQAYHHRPSGWNGIKRRVLNLAEINREYFHPYVRNPRIGRRKDIHRRARHRVRIDSHMTRQGRRRLGGRGGRSKRPSGRVSNGRSAGGGIGVGGGKGIRRSKALGRC